MFNLLFVEPWKNLLSLSRATTIMRLKTPRNKKEPKLLVHVLHALADLKDARGSTLRKITDQVQIAINLSRTKPKPKNVLGQVRRALRHGVQTGVLKHRAGKFRLATATEINHALKRSVGRRSARKKAIITGKRKKRVRRRRSRRHYSKLNNLHSSPTEENVLQQSYNNYSNIADQQQSVPEMDHPTYVMARRRRKRNPEKRRRKKSGRRKKRRRDFDKAVNLDGNPYGDDDIRNHRNSGKTFFFKENHSIRLKSANITSLFLFYT